MESREDKSLSQNHVFTFSFSDFTSFIFCINNFMIFHQNVNFKPRLRHIYIYIYIYNPSGLIRGLKIEPKNQLLHRSSLCFFGFLRKKTNFCAELASVFLVFPIFVFLILQKCVLFFLSFDFCFFGVMFFVPQHFLISDLRFPSQIPGELAKKITENPIKISCSSLWLTKKTVGTRKIRHENKTNDVSCSSLWFKKNPGELER